MRRRRQRRRTRPMVLPIFLFLLFLFLFVYGSYFLKTTVEPNLEDIAKFRARAMVNKMVNGSINKQFSKQADINNLLIIDKNKDGTAGVVQSNTKEMNLLITNISKELNHRVVNVQPEKMEVPLGAVLGSKILSQTGPSINLKIKPLSVSGMDFKTEFEAQGINQTKYKVYITLKSQVKVLAPFSDRTFSFTSTILIAEAVILGNVPNSYVQVPKESIIDGLQITE